MSPQTVDPANGPPWQPESTELHSTTRKRDPVYIVLHEREVEVVIARAISEDPADRRVDVETETLTVWEEVADTVRAPSRRKAIEQATDGWTPEQLKGRFVAIRMDEWRPKSPEEHVERTVRWV